MFQKTKRLKVEDDYASWSTFFLISISTALSSVWYRFLSFWFVVLFPVYKIILERHPKEHVHIEGRSPISIVRFKNLLKKLPKFITFVEMLLGKPHVRRRSTRCGGGLV